jgi:hypothetical protein
VLVFVGVLVIVEVGVIVGVSVIVAVAVGVGERIGVSVGVAEAVNVGVFPQVARAPGPAWEVPKLCTVRNASAVTLTPRVGKSGVKGFKSASIRTTTGFTSSRLAHDSPSCGHPYGGTGEPGGSEAGRVGCSYQEPSARRFARSPGLTNAANTLAGGDGMIPLELRPPEGPYAGSPYS